MSKTKEWQCIKTGKQNGDVFVVHSVTFGQLSEELESKQITLT